MLGPCSVDGFTSIRQQGVCPETEWTYDDDNSGANSKYRQRTISTMLY